METATAILKNLISPLLEKDSSYDSNRTTGAFWENLSRDLINFEEDPKPVYAAIYSLELADPERVIRKLSKAQDSFIAELAEQYVLGNSSEAIQVLKEIKHPLFTGKVQYFQDLKTAITALERKRLIEEVPLTYELLTAPLSDETIAAAIKKKSREDLRNKFWEWDVEMKEKAQNVISFNNSSHYIPPPEPSATSLKKEKKGKVISFSWVKYAAAACVLFAAGLFYFNSERNSFPKGSEMVNTDDGELIEPGGENVELVELEESTIYLKILQPSGLGYSETTEKKTLEIKFLDATARISALQEILDENKGENLSALREEFSRLLNRQGKYSFNGNQLTFYRKSNNADFQIIQLEENQFYLQKGNMFYKLPVSETPHELKEVTGERTLEELERIIFINE